MKNEKVALVFFAYIIGFTTAFIAFALSDKGYSVDATLAAKSYPEEGTNINKVQNHNIEVVNKPEGLFMLNGSEERVLSATASDGVSGEGFHTEIFSSSVSPDGQYIHFCASLVGEPGICTNFVYGVADDLIYRIRVGEESLKTDKEESGITSWISGDTLKFSVGSASAASNWSIR